MGKRKTFVILIVMLQLLTQLLNVESRPEAKKGKGKAFGAGILAGGLAGAAMGHLLTRQNNPTEVHHHHHIVDPNASASNTAVPVASRPPIPAPRPPAIIEKGETLANGCYRQIVKEPDAYDMTRFIETEQLICPTNVPPSPVYTQQALAVPAVPQAQPQPIVPAVPIIPVATPATPLVIPIAPENVLPTNAPAILPPNSGSIHTAPENLLPTNAPPNMPPNTGSILLQPDPQQNHGTAPLHPVLPQPLPPPVQPAVPVIIPPPPPPPSQVIILSKKSGFYEEDKMKKNFASNLLAINFGIMLFIAGFLLLI